MKLKKFLPLLVSATFFLPAQLHAAPVTVNVHKADLRDTIMLVAKTGGLNVSIDGSIKGKISISFNNLDPVKALEIIAKTRNLKLVNENGIYVFTSEHYTALMQTYVFPIRYGDAEILRQAVVMSLDNDKKPDDSNDDGNSGRRSSYEYESASRTRYKTNADGSVDVFTNYLSNSDLSDRKNSNSRTDRNLTQENRVYVNPEVNALVLFGTPAEYERVKNLLATLDVELKQVSVEARIVAIEKEEAKNLGVEWTWASLDGTYSAQTGRTRSSESSRGYSNESSRDWSAQAEQSNSVSRKYSTKDGYSNEVEHGTQRGFANQLLNSDIFSGSGLIQFGRSLTSAAGLNWALSAQINALVTDGKAKILSRPNVTTIQGREAVINVGSSVPVQQTQTTNSTVTTSVEYRDAGIILKYTPRVNVDGTITATIHTEVSTPQYVADLKAYRFNTRSADTTVTVRNGEPMVIGGLIGAEEAKSVSKIPFLGDLPILGALFKNHRNSKTESELIIFLTAHVIGGGEVNQPFERRGDEFLPDKP